MPDDFNHSELFEEFPELAEPDVILSKEVLAHFGLLFSTYADLEAGVQNCYTIWQLRAALLDGKIKTQIEWVEMYDVFENKAFASTFGSLLKLVSGFDQLTPHMSTLDSLKKKRDYFAHHFFREENNKLFSSESTLHLLSRMHVLRKEVGAASQIVAAIHAEMMQSLYPSRDLNAEITADTVCIKEGYFNNPSKEFGWETD